MSNSPLVSYTRLSPNHSGLRNHKIDTITIHHMGGCLTVEQCGNVFAPTSRQASSNYGIDSSGKIAMYVEEKNRAWTTSSASNDNRAITIEVANSKYGEPWPISDKAMASLINLCADICKRNGIAKLRYTGDKSGTMTLHKWFAATGCPGTYLSGKMTYIQDEVNKKLSGADKKPAPSKKGTPPDVTYRVRTTAGKWLAATKNLTRYAGSRGAAITDVAIAVSKGSVKYRVHIAGGSWLPWVTGYNIKDDDNGYAGIGKPIDALQIEYNNAAGKYFKIRYRLSAVNRSWYPTQVGTSTSNGMDGYAGELGTKADRLQIRLA